MNRAQLHRTFLILVGFLFISITFYVCYTKMEQQTPHQQGEKSYLKSQFLSHKSFQDDYSLVSAEDGLSSGSDAFPGLSSTDRRQQSLVVPVRGSTAECLPYPEDLHVQPVNDHDCEQPHVLMNHGGRLGNKLCQYASVYLLRHLYGVRVAVRESMRLFVGNSFKNVSLSVQDSGCLTKNTTPLTYDAVYMKLYTAAVEARERAADKNLLTVPLLNDSYYVYNNPCPRALLMDHRELVRSILRYRDEVISSAVSRINKAIQPYNGTYFKRDFPIVTVHVRRTDYTAYIKRKYNLTQLDDTYFKKAFDFYKERLKEPVFLVLSDDPTWCRMNFVANDVVVMDKGSPPLDMATISLGDHHVTSYGTFSFTAALLGRGHVTHPISNNGRYNLADCIRSPFFHYISRDKTYEVDNSHVRLV